MAFEYQGFASLGINLNRQKYGPLDISQVFLNMNDVKYYISKGTFTHGVSTYWFTDENTKIVPYPYNGQLISVIADGKPELYILEEIAEAQVTEEIDETEVQYTKYFNLVKAGKSYTAGENITITEEGVISAAGKVYEGDGKTITVNEAGQFTFAGYDDLIATQPTTLKGYRPELDGEGKLVWVEAVSSEMSDEQVVANITQLNKDVGELEGTAAALRTDVDTVSSTAAELRTDVDTVSSTAAALRTDVDTVSGTVNTHTTAIASHAETLSQLRTDVNGIDEDISYVSGQVNTKVSQEAFNELTATVANKADKTTVEGLDGRVTTAEGEIDTLQGQVGTLETSASTLSEKVGTLETGASALSGRVDTAEDEIDDLQGKVNTLETSASTLSEKVGTLESGASALSGRVDTAEDEIDALQTSIETKATVADLTELSGKVTTAEDEIDALQASVATKAAAADLAELSGKVTTAEGEIDALQASVATKAEVSAVNDLASRVNEIQSAGVNYEVVDSLPTESGKKGIIYLVPNTEGDTPAVGEYIEYICIVAAAEGTPAEFERIGTTAADFTNYVTTTTFTELAGKVTTAEGKIDALQASVATKAAASDVTELSGKVTTAEGKITTLESGATALSGRVDILETGAEALSGRVTAAEGNIDILETGAEALSGRVATAEGEIDTVSSDLIDVTTTVNNNTAAINTKADKTTVNELSSTVGTLETGATALSGRVTAAEGEIDTVSSDVYLESNLKLTVPFGTVQESDISANGYYEVPDTAGKSITDVLMSLLYAVKEPTVTLPTATITLTPTYDPPVKNGSNVEIGTKLVSVDYSIAYTDGSYTYGPTAGTSVSAYKVTNDKNNTVTTAATGTFDFSDAAQQITDKADYVTVTAEVSYKGGTAKPLTSVKQESTAVDPIADGIYTATKALNVSGSYWSYYYIDDEDCTTVIDSEFIRTKATSKNSDTLNFGTVEIPAGTTRVMFAVPGNHTLTSVMDVDGMGLDVKGNFTTEENVQVNGANGYKATNYTVFHYENPAGMAATKYTVSIK